MNTARLIALPIVLLGLGALGCHSSPTMIAPAGVRSADSGSVFRVQAAAVAPVAADQPILIKCWSIDCLDPEDPDAAALLGGLPGLPARTQDGFDPDIIASHLESLDARQQLDIRSMPMLIVRGGEKAIVKITEPIDRPDLQAGVERGESLFPFEVGERYEIQTAIEDDGLIVLDINYSRESLTGDVEEPLPGVTTSRIRHTVRLRSGESVVLGGWRSHPDAADAGTAESVQIVVVNARAVPPVSQPQAAAR